MKGDPEDAPGAVEEEASERKGPEVSLREGQGQAGGRFRALGNRMGLTL